MTIDLKQTLVGLLEHSAKVNEQINACRVLMSAGHAVQNVEPQQTIRDTISLPAPKRGEPAPKRGDTLKRVFDAIKSGKTTRSELRGLATEATLTYTVCQLKKRGLIRYTGKGQYAVKGPRKNAAKK